MVDQQHPRCFGYAGHPVVKTPHIDRLAREGVSFTRAYVANPLCMPSRASIFTGLTTRGHRARMNGIPLDPSIPTFVEGLRQAGYRTHAAGKLHFATSGTPKGVPLDAVDVRHFPEASELWKSGRVTALPLPYHGFQTVDFINGHGHGSWGHYLHWLERERPDAYPLFRDRVPLEPPSPAYTMFNRQSYKWALPEDAHPTHWIADRAIDFLDGAKSSEEPFFLFASFQEPHSPFAPPAPWCYRHAPEDAPPPPRREGELDHLPPHFKQQYETTLTTQGSFGQLMAATEPYARECAAHYFGLIELVDHHVGRILDAHHRNGLDENTLVLFTADHGEALGDHGMWGKGPYHFDGVIRVPLIARWIGHTPREQPSTGAAGAQGVRGRGVVVAHDAVVSLLDLAPTILEATGAPLPPWPGAATPAVPEAPNAPSALAGRSLFPILRGASPASRDTVALVEEDEDYLGLRLRTVVTQRYRLTAYSGQPYGELFDLQEDPNEYENLWDDAGAAAVKQELLLRLLEKTMETELALPRQSSRA